MSQANGREDQYQEDIRTKFKASWTLLFFWTRKTWQTKNRWIDLFCDWWACTFVGLVDCWCLVELLNQGSNCKDVQSWVCQYVIACRQDSDKIDNMMGDIFVGDIGQFDSRLSRCSPIQDYCWPLCNCNWSCGRPGLWTQSCMLKLRFAGQTWCCVNNFGHS